MKKIIATPEGGIEVEMTEEEIAEVVAREERARTVDIPLSIRRVELLNLTSKKNELVAQINEMLAEGGEGVMARLGIGTSPVEALRSELRATKLDITIAQVEIEHLESL